MLTFVHDCNGLAQRSYGPVRLPLWPPPTSDVEAATLAQDGSPPITRTTIRTCHAHYPGGSSGCSCRLLPRSCSLPQMAETAYRRSAVSSCSGRSCCSTSGGLSLHGKLLLRAQNQLMPPDRREVAEPHAEPDDDPNDLSQPRSTVRSEPRVDMMSLAHHVLISRLATHAARFGHFCHGHASAFSQFLKPCWDFSLHRR